MGEDDLGWQGYVVIVSLVLAFIAMGTDKVGPDIVFTVLVAFFTGSTILTVKEASEGYSNSGLLTVIFLYLVSEGVYQTGVLEGVMTRILGRSRSPFWALVRMMIPCMILSAFLNNTPVVALLTPILISWAKRSGVPAKKLLIPLSYAAVLGGTCTLIGTSTNLVVAGSQSKRYEKLKKFEDINFGIFDIAPQGVPYAVWGFLFVLLTQKWLLPGNSSKFAQDLLLALRVHHASPVRGKSILDGGLRGLHGATVVAACRDGAMFRNPAPHFRLEEGDVIYFKGEFDQIEFWGEELGLELVTNETETSPGSMAAADLGTTAGQYTKLVQVTLAKDCSLVGSAVSASGLRTKFDAAVVGIERSTDRADGRFSDVVLKAGDTLVLDIGKHGDMHSKEFIDTFTGVHPLKEGAVKDFILALKVVAGAAAGQTVSEAGLRGIQGLSVLALDRAGDSKQRIEPVGHHDVLKVGDTLWVGAELGNVSFLSKFPGLELGQQDQINKTGINILYQGLQQAVVAANGGLVGTCAKATNFRKRFDAAVVAIHRQGVHHPISASEEVFQPGDVLLLAAHSDWSGNFKNDRNFVLVRDVPNSSPPKKSRGLLSVFLVVAMVLTQIIPSVKDNSEWISLWPASVLTAAVMLGVGAMSGKDARQSIQWDVYLAIAGAFGVSKAMELTGVAGKFAELFVTIGESVGGRGAGLTSIYVATALLSELLTNNASGAIMYPIAATAGDRLGIEPRAMSIAIMLGASAGFINPFSYQCNMMVYTAGNYRTKEFAKIGAPFQAYLLIVAACILFAYDQWQLVWIVTFVVAGAIIGIPIIWAALPPATILKIEERIDAFRQRLHPHKSGSRKWLDAGANANTVQQLETQLVREESRDLSDMGVPSGGSSVVDEPVKKPQFLGLDTTTSAATGPGSSQGSGVPSVNIAMSGQPGGSSGSNSSKH